MAGIQSIAGKIDASMEKKDKTKKDARYDEKVNEKRDQVYGIS